MIKNLSVFFPLFNEEGNVRQAVEKAEQVLKKLKIEYEILLVDDGSTDDTPKIIDQIEKENKYVRAIHHEKNLGYGEALKSGFYNAKNDVICYTDGDGQFDFSEVDKFLEKIEDCDLIIGYRIKRQDPFFRILFKKGWGLSLFAFFGLTLKDVDCGFKMIRKKVLEKIPKLESTRGAMINAEIAIKAKKYGFKVTQVGVNHYPRLSGKPTGASFNVIIRSFFDLFRLWWKLKDQKSLFVILVLVLMLASFLRFYRLDEYMTFLGDEGRDAIIVKGILTGQNFPLIGPPTSVGNIYLGPLYYYMMAASMASTLNPVAAAGMNALIGVLTVGLIYYLGKVWFGRVSALISAYLYAISPVTIIYSRSSWNPNPAPFFALIGIFSLYKVHKSGNFLWLVLTGLSIAAAVQMHYLALILIPVAILLLCHEILYSRYKEIKFKNLVKGSILGVASFLIIMSPLFIFDLKHDFLNYKAVSKLISENNAVKGDLLQNVSKIPALYSYNLIGRYITSENIYLTVFVSILMLLPLIFFYIERSKSKTVDWPVLAVSVWLLVGLLGMSFYRQDVYDHYLGFVNPAPFLLLGAGLFYVTHFSHIKKILIYALILYFLLLLSLVNFQKNPLRNSPNNQLKRTQDIAKFIIEKSDKKDFNFALLAQKNYDSAYQFYLEFFGHKPKQLPFDKTDQLFVVCEDSPCEPINNPKYEIAAFGWAKISEEYLSSGLKIYKLVPNPEGKPQ